MNIAAFTGRTTKDVELRSTQSGKHVTSFTLAVNRFPEGTDFIECVAWGKNAELMDKYVQKGHKVLIQGHMQSRSYEDRDGKTIYKTECVVDLLEFLEPKRSDSNDSGIKPAAAPAFQPVDVDPDEDLPF